MLAAAKRLDLDRLDLDRLVGADKAEALKVHRLECCAAHISPVGADRQRRSGGGFAHPTGAACGLATLPIKGRDGACCAALPMTPAERCRCRDSGDAPGATRAPARPTPWPTSSSRRVRCQRRRQSLGRGEAVRVEPAQHRLAARGLQLGEPHAVGGQHPRQRMDQHVLEAERVGDKAGMLAAGAAESVQHIVRDVVAALHRDGLDRVRHVLDRDPDEAVGDLRRLVSVADLGSKRGEARLHDPSVERLVLTRTEDLGEERGHELPHHHIGVGHGERAAAAIAGRSRYRARGIRSDTEARAVVMRGSSRRRQRRYG